MRMPAFERHFLWYHRRWPGIALMVSGAGPVFGGLYVMLRSLGSVQWLGVGLALTAIGFLMALMGQVHLLAHAYYARPADPLEGTAQAKERPLRGARES